MKRMITSALAVLLLAGAAQAQGRDKGDRKEHRGEMKELNLSSDQKTKMKSLHERQKAEMDAIRDNKNLTKEQRRDQARQVHEKYQAERKALLTPEQQQKVAQFREEHKGDRRGPGGPGRAGDGGRDTIRRRGGEAPVGMRGDKGQRGERLQGMAKDLNLSADQQQKMKSIRDGYRSKFEAVRADNSLSKDQKKQKAQELMKAQMSEMKTVLTPEQQQKLKEKRKGRGGDVR